METGPHAQKVNRREFVRRSACGAGAIALGAGIGTGCGASAMRSATAKKGSKPNLLFIWTDQQRWDTLPTYGNSRVEAPNLEALARRSAVFDRSYVTHPVCTPSRGSVMTGMWPQQTGVTQNNIPLPESSRALPELLADPDYRTGHIGKWHLGDELFAQHGFEEWVGTEDTYQEHFTPGRDRSVRSGYHHWLVEKGHTPDRDENAFSRDYACRLPLEQGKPAFQAEVACDFIERHSSEPWMLYVSYLEPHTPFVSPLSHLYPEEEMELAESYRAEPDPSRPIRYALLQEYHERKYGRHLRRDRNHFQSGYWGNVTTVDRSVGRILSKLEQLGLAEDTIVVFTSDHGEMMSDHRMWEKGVFYEQAMRVPTLIRVPGLTDRGGRIEHQMSHINLVPTLLDLMASEVPEILPGRSVAPLIRGSDLPHETVFGTWMANSNRWKLNAEGELGSDPENHLYLEEHSRVCIAPEGWKLILSDRDRPQLFNLEDDPMELQNRYGNSQDRSVVVDLTDRLEAWQVRTGDSLELRREA